MGTLRLLQLGRILVLAVELEDGGVPGTAPLLLLAVNGTLEADWDTMRIKACVSCTGGLALSEFTGTQAGDVSCAFREQASWDDGYDGDDDGVKLGEWE